MTSKQNYKKQSLWVGYVYFIWSTLCNFLFYRLHLSIALIEQSSWLAIGFMHVDFLPHEELVMYAYFVLSKRFK